ncbi:hypothetical protein [Marivirga tractuosa]|nr:hypothetical protein [Marivirga tractuosa]
MRYRLLNFIKKYILLSFLTISWFILLAQSAHAQSVKNVEAKVLDDIIVVTYDLNGNLEEEFTVNLYSSKDNFETPLTLVTGDVGLNVKPGKGKRIEWLSKSELGEFKGNLIFELRAFLPEPAFDPLEFVNFNLTEIKSGKSYRIQWQGGKPNEKIDILLYEDGQQKSRIAQVDNSGKYFFKIPKGNKSSNYRIQLDGETGTVGSSQFKIKSGISPLLIAGGGLVVGGIVAVILLLDNPGSSSDLPIAPEPN